MIGRRKTGKLFPSQVSLKKFKSSSVFNRFSDSMGNCTKSSQVILSFQLSINIFVRI